jgi:NAD(P)H-nitrite reductase large subunit
MNTKLFGGINKNRNGTFSITPHMPFGRLDIDQLEAVFNVLQRFNLPGVQANTAQRIVIDNIPAEFVDEAVKMLNGIGSYCQQSITACKGLRGCKRGLQDTQEMAMHLEEILIGFNQMPAHLKVGLSGCHRCCGASYVKDIGLVGTSKGWTLVFGGNAGRMVRCGDEILVNTSQEKLLEILKGLLLCYIENAEKGERTARFVERFGINSIKNHF